jgi:8-oxo-dGTP pyrophosphatase MutT (NUDIX family)
VVLGLSTVAVQPLPSAARVTVSTRPLLYARHVERSLVRAHGSSVGCWPTSCRPGVCLPRGLTAEPSGTPEPQPVVAAIVTSPRGVLIARRNDGKPPWTCIAGEIEPGESPADAAVREVKEETGLRVTAGGVIGRRVHPKTGRTMVYMAARPTHGTDAFVGDEDELAEIRWVDLREADELMGGMIFEPVHDHLSQVLPEGLQ